MVNITFATRQNEEKQLTTYYQYNTLNKKVRGIEQEEEYGSQRLSGSTRPAR